METGRQALISGQYERAVIIFTKELFHNPEDHDLYLGKASAYLGLGDLQSALVCMRRAAQLAVDDDAIGNPIAVVLADLYSAVGDLLDENDDDRTMMANEYHREAIRLNPSNPQLQMKRINCLCRSGQFPAAAQAISEMLDGSSMTSSDPIYVDLLVRRHQLYLELQRYDEAIGDYRSIRTCLSHAQLDSRLLQAEKRSRYAADLLHTDAQAQVLMGQIPRAMKLVTTALELDSGNAHHLRLRATIRRIQGEHQAALEDLRQARDHAGDPIVLKQINRELARTENDLALDDCRRNQWSAAIERLHRCVSLLPDQFQYYTNRADCYVQLQKFHHAQADYHEAMRLIGANAALDRHRIQVKLSTIHFAFGIEAFNRRSLSEAASEFTEAIRLSKGRIAQYYMNRAETFEQMHNLALAIADYMETLRIDPNQRLARDRVSALSAGVQNQLLPVRIGQRRANTTPSHLQQILARRHARLVTSTAASERERNSRI